MVCLQEGKGEHVVNTMTCVPKLKVEQESSQRTQAIIDKDWFKLGERFLRSTGFKDWILRSTDTSN